ncbi:hypothetical protein BCR44DRAFT_1100811 [Catenaria anguillulae PL171]|uniref:Ankyrin repeat-containing domain protein n=1 Tax=Catenaria anguillulae PL171 TaxID=765915 RepID=A0A1Y2I1T1_9FUNG|nr:hypothetical protein BCR44DRAFT_1100811 [Catenaria anguillulae PL171]
MDAVARARCPAARAARAIAAPSRRRRERRGFRGMTPLHEAAKGKGHAELVRMLLDHGADPRAATDGPGMTPIDVCDDAELKRVMAEYPYRATRADEVRRQLLEEIARTSGGVHGDWQSGSAAAGPNAAAAAHVDPAETVLSDTGGGGGGGQDESKSERSRDDAASTSTHQQRSGASYGGGAGGDPRKMTREERLMASYIARIERQEQRKQQQQQSQQGGKAGGSGEAAKRKKSSATSLDIGKAAEKAVEKTTAAAVGSARGSKAQGDDGARETKSGGAGGAASSAKTKGKESSKKANGSSTSKARESPAPSSSVHEAATEKSRSAGTSAKSSKANQSADPTSTSAADLDQRPPKKRAKTLSSATDVPDTTVRVDDLPQYCTSGDAARVTKALNLPGVIAVLPKAILAASRAGHVELVRVVVDRLAAAHASGAANAPANLTGGKPVLSVQQVVTAALHQAVKQEHVDVAGYLLSKGAKATARNRAGQTPIEQARVLGNRVLVSLLEQAASGSSSGLAAALSGSAGGGVVDEEVLRGMTIPWWWMTR